MEPRDSIVVAVDGRAKVIAEVPSAPTVRLTMPFETFVALCGGRQLADDPSAMSDVRIDGDEDLGRRSRRPPVHALTIRFGRRSLSGSRVSGSVEVVEVEVLVLVDVVGWSRSTAW